MESTDNDNKRWKYLSFVLIGLLAAGSTVSFLPQASAHITTNVQHMLEHIYNFVDGIEAKTNNLPADPASNTVVNTRASQTSVGTLQTTATGIDAKVTNIQTMVDGLGSGSGFGDDGTAFLIAVHCGQYLFSPLYAPNCILGEEVNLSGAELQDAILYGTRLPHANLSGADFSGAELRLADLIGADLSGADFSGAELGGAILSGSKSSNTNFSGADLGNASLIGGDRSSANFQNADLFHADLSGANLSSANFQNADLSGANLSNTDLSGAIFTGCHGNPIGTPAVGTLPTCAP